MVIKPVGNWVLGGSGVKLGAHAHCAVCQRGVALVIGVIYKASLLRLGLKML